MSITVNTNLSSMIAQRSLYKATNKMNTALERLSTGARINSSKDDASGSAISTKLSYKISSYNVAKDNAQMGQSMLETANGSLSQINSMLQRIRDLSEQASNGTYGMDERKAMQAEIDGLTEEIYRIKNTTEFNGKKVLGETSSYEELNLSSNPTINFEDIDIWDLSEDEWNENFKGQIIGISNTSGLENLASLVNILNYDTSGTTFALTADIDFGGDDWIPIGNSYWDKPFCGNFDGNGYTISNMYIYNPNEENQGLFGCTKDGIIKNLNISNCEVLGKNYVGGLVGACYSTIENCFVSGVVSGKEYVGGLCGNSSSATVTDSSFEGTVSGNRTVGGLSGWNSSGTIKNCYVSANISGNDDIIGGLCGNISWSATVTDSSFEGTVIGNNVVGGFIGYIENDDYATTTIKNCYSSADVSGNSNVGKFIGDIFLYGEGADYDISNCYYNQSKSTSLDVIGQNESEKEDPIIKAIDKNPLDPPKKPYVAIKTVNINLESKTNLQVGINSDSSSTITVDTGVDFGDFKVSVLEESDARESLSKIDEMMDKVTAKMTEIGSAQNRLESTMEFQDVQISALTSANSLIKDADIAEESSNYIKNQILQNVTSSLLATANQNPSIALQLL